MFVAPVQSAIDSEDSITTCPIEMDDKSKMRIRSVRFIKAKLWIKIQLIKSILKITQLFFYPCELVVNVYLTLE